MFNHFSKIPLILFFCLFGLALNFNLFSGGRMGEKIFPVQADTFNFVTTSVEILLVCGDGSIDPYYEVCDPGNPPVTLPNTGTTTCHDFIDRYSGLPFASGRLTCASDCLAYSTSTCYTCGDNHKQTLEECDGTDFGGSNDCVNYGYTTGSLRCTPDCRLDLSGCSMIGILPTPGNNPPSGGSSGGTFGYVSGTKIPPDQTIVIINGNGYPNREVRVLIDGTVTGIVKADSKGDFHFQSGDITPGVSTFGLWTDDERGLKSTLLTLTFRAASKSVTTIENVYLSPTIDVDKNQVNKGEDVKIFGKSTPAVDIAVHVNSDLERVATTTSGTLGDWSLVFNTAALAEDFHTAKALIHLQSPSGVIESNFSRTVSFYVGKNIPEKGKCGIADLNCDGSVNLVDFSILLYNWGTADTTSDINKDGKVGLADFSIMMFYWTG
ncbi:MAG: hypothetical protein PHO56_01530 [Patescibacteria group bacterium]|nr:hypothetical protein [Patescibacteria group bacterium]